MADIFKVEKPTVCDNTHEAMHIMKTKGFIKPFEVRTHKTITAAECYRIVDKNKFPIVNISKRVAGRLLKMGIIKELPILPTRKTQAKLFDDPQTNY